MVWCWRKYLRRGMMKQRVVVVHLLRMKLFHNNRCDSHSLNILLHMECNHRWCLEGLNLWGNLMKHLLLLLVERKHLRRRTLKLLKDPHQKKLESKKKRESKKSVELIVCVGVFCCFFVVCECFSRKFTFTLRNFFKI